MTYWCITPITYCKLYIYMGFLKFDAPYNLPQCLFHTAAWGVELDFSEETKITVIWLPQLPPSQHTVRGPI
uniref:Uncharacterized protein n=1 Tax=Gossypium raimondii TaxID=29730 RepID=A0A0D2TKB2_GOSRA|nr:hypothetical protein B456_009G151500 [Gossypium raimondii]